MTTELVDPVTKARDIVDIVRDALAWVNSDPPAPTHQALMRAELESILEFFGAEYDPD